MSNGLEYVLFLLLNLIEILLKIVFVGLNCVYFIIKLPIHYIINVNMIEGSKRRKKNSNEQPNLTVAVRGMIDANWQKLLSNTKLMENKTEKSKEEKKEQFTGTFRRARKKKNDEAIAAAENDETLNLAHLAVQNELGPEKKEIKNGGKNKMTKFLAMDCEMVGVGYDGNDHMLARVSIVNKFGDCVYDKFVKPREEVKDYRTSVSGVRKEDLLTAEDFNVVQKEVSELIRGKVLVGHSLKNDLSVLFLSHPKRSIRDTSRYKPFRKITKGSTPSLKRLSKDILGIDIQHGEHSSVEDARAAMQLYCTVAKKWEASLSEKRGHRRFDE